MNYYVSSNLDGRPNNTPIIVDVPSCEKPYYYILNYHYPEEKERIILIIYKIYGEINNKRIVTPLNKADWYELIDNMVDMEGNEFLIKNFITSYVIPFKNVFHFLREAKYKHKNTSKS